MAIPIAAIVSVASMAFEAVRAALELAPIGIKAGQDVIELVKSAKDTFGKKPEDITDADLRALEARSNALNARIEAAGAGLED